MLTTQANAVSRYLPVSDEDRDWQIYCTCFGSSVITPGSGYPLRPAEHPATYISDWRSPGRGRVLEEFQLLYITRGRGTLYSGGQLYRIIEGTVFLLFPGVPHWYSPDIDTGWVEYWVGFSGSYPTELMSKGFFSPRAPVHTIGVHDSLVRGFRRLSEIGETQPPGYQQLCGAEIMGLLARMVSLSKQNERPSRVETCVARARTLFEENLTSSIEMKDLTGVLDVDYDWFRSVFKAETGLSPYQYFLKLKIDRAKELLLGTDLQIQEIAHELAFENQYYFSRVFKNKTGFCPMEWRRRSSAVNPR